MVKSVGSGSVKAIGILGMFIGALIAIGVPYTVLAPEVVDRLGTTAPILLALVGILGGVVLAVVTGFFSIVVPASVAKQNAKAKDEGDTGGEAKGEAEAKGAGKTEEDN